MGLRMLKRSLFLPILLLSLCFTLAFGGCNRQTTGPVSTGSSSNTNVLRLLYWQAPTILNPHLSTGFKDAEAGRITLEPLASSNSKGQLIPFLAAEIPSKENGGLAADGKSVTWKLKQGVKWSDGQPFTADDVVFTYEFISNPKTGSTSAGPYEIVKSVEAVNPHEVKITFKTVNPAPSSLFVGTEGMILPKHLYKDFTGEKARSAPANLLPVGTGPYKVIQFKPGDTVVYEANGLFREKDKLGFQRIELKGGGDATSAARAVLQTGEADYAYNLQVEAPVLKQLETGGKGKLVSEFGSLIERIIFNLSNPNKTTSEGERSSVTIPHPFFADAKVREAFILAIDRDTISQQLYGITGKPTANFLVQPPEYNSPNTSYKFDLAKAKQLLEAAGWKDTNNDGTRDKNGVEMKPVFQTSVNPLRQKTQEIIKQNLASIGVGVELRSIDAGVFFSSDPANNDTVEKFQADLQMFTTGNNVPDPSTYMKTYTCSAIPQKKNNWAGENYSRFCDKDYDALWVASTTELDEKKRQELFIKMNDMLIKNFMVIPLVHRADVVGISNRLDGFELTPWDRNTWNIKDWKIKQPT
ncbi:MAG: Oligopeptide-binding protein AppA [Chroococcopsis gigantea SAG 12.99]|jgi:peptide/nickel transport system substrate-binding protein|nr:Oligopeptide-binding protein AppA [Chroococcopsis gigantea SAG 12.99]